MGYLNIDEFCLFLLFIFFGGGVHLNVVISYYTSHAHALKVLQ